MLFVLRKSSLIQYVVSDDALISAKVRSSFLHCFSEATTVEFCVKVQAFLKKQKFFQKLISPVGCEKNLTSLKYRFNKRVRPFPKKFMVNLASNIMFNSECSLKMKSYICKNYLSHPPQNFFSFGYRILVHSELTALPQSIERIVELITEFCLKEN